jgi:hypothetical protein
MLEQLLTQELWLALSAWALSYASDFALTLYTARLYHARAREHFSFGGSFELTPYYQADVDRLRRWSPRLWLALGLSAVLVALVWVLSVVVLGLPAFFTFLIGALLLRQAAVILRHLRNLVLFRAVRDTTAVSGQIAYARPLVLRLSAAELGALGGLFLLLALVTSSWFLLGGAVACGVTAYQHARLARTAWKQAAAQRA